MRSIINNFQKEFVAEFIIFTFIIFSFRLDLLNTIHEIYPFTDDVTLPGYLVISFFNDLPVFIIFFMFSFGSKFLFKKSKIIRILFSGLLFQGMIIFYFIALGFFRIYEQPFHFSIISHGATGGVAEFIQSARAEITPELKRFSIFASVINWALLLFFFNLKKNEKTRSKFNLVFVLPIYIIIFSIIHFFNINNYREMEKKLDQKKILNINSLSFNELRNNPLFEFFAEEKKTLKPISQKERSKRGNKTFKFGFDSASLESPKIYPRIFNIPRNKKYNVIFYIFESTPQRYLGIKYKGISITPTWNRLMRNSFVARNHYTNFPLSVNALFIIFSSAYSMPSDRWIPQDYPDIALESIPQILKKNGYRTMHIHPGDLGYAWQREYLSHRGFDVITEYDNLKSSPYKTMVNWGLDDRSMIKPAVKFMKKKSSRPFFVVFQPVSPHHPFKVPEKKFRITKGRPPGVDYKKRNWLNYLNCLYYSDTVLGELIHTLEKDGLMKDTLLFVFSDHGEAFYQHRRNYNHPLFVYEENVHVPFIIYNKNFFPRKYSYSGISRHIDIGPTLLDILGLQKNPKFEGISLFSSHKAQMALFHTFWNKDISGIRDGRWKYIRQMETGLEELYDLENDKGEKINLADNNRELLERYRRKILAMREYKIGFFKKVTNNNYPKTIGRSNERFR